jgi:hypothetical protein
MVVKERRERALNVRNRIARASVFLVDRESLPRGSESASPELPAQLSSMPQQPVLSQLRLLSLLRQLCNLQLLRQLLHQLCQLRQLLCLLRDGINRKAMQRIDLAADLTSERSQLRLLRQLSLLQVSRRYRIDSVVAREHSTDSIRAISHLPSASLLAEQSGDAASHHAAQGRACKITEESLRCKLCHTRIALLNSLLNSIHVSLVSFVIE